MKMARCFMVSLIVVLLLLVGCAERSGRDPINKAEDPVVVKPTLPLPSEFEDVKRALLKAGILNEDTPVYRLGEMVETRGSRFYMKAFTWVGRSITIRFNFLGERQRDERRRLWTHRVRLIVDDQKWRGTSPNFNEEGDDYWMVYRFELEVPDSYQDHVLVLVSIKDPDRSFKPEPVKQGDVAFIITSRDIKRRY